MKVREMGGFFTTICGAELRTHAADPLDGGLGYSAAADALGIPREAVRQWQTTCRATGRDGLLDMGKRHGGYDF